MEQKKTLVVCKPVEQLGGALDEQQLKRLCPRKRNRIERMGSESAKLSTAAADLLARKTVAEYLGKDENEVCVCVLSKGAPSVKGGGAYVSLSHSGRLVACAVSSVRVGVDVQRVKLPSIAVVQRVCSEKECEYIDFAESGAALRFTTLWTLKEAYCKAAGVPLMLACTECCFVTCGGELVPQISDYRFEHTELSDGYVLALCESTVI